MRTRAESPVPLLQSAHTYEGTTLMKPSISRITINRAMVAGVALVLAASAFAGSVVPVPAKISPLSERFAISGQVTPDQLADLKARGYDTIISLRPDGESPDQPSAAQMNDAARSNGVAFAYVPVASAAVSDAAVAALSQALAVTSGKGRVLLYCRSGSRAARTWSLLEASRSGGADANAILAAVKASGQSADDLRAAIADRVSARAATGQ
jgi:uncharacterized protein (TIGR01244 family)